MKAFYLLLGGVDRRAGNLIEVLVRDVCYSYAIVECVRVDRVDDFIRAGRDRDFDLIILAPAHLLPPPGQPAGVQCFHHLLRGISVIRQQKPVPVIAVNAVSELHENLAEVGVDSMIGIPIDYDRLKAEVRRLLQLPEPAEEAAAVEHKSSLFGVLLRGFQRSKPA
jgi:hypothetical protein